MRLFCLLSALGSVLGQPPDWEHRIDVAQLRWTNSTPTDIATCYFPAVGNGFLGQVVGPQKVDTPDYGACGWMYLSGVHNGLYTDYPSASVNFPSHRAALGSLTDVTVRQVEGLQFSSVGAAVDFEYGVYYNRTFINTPTCVDTVVELRQFAHRQYRDLLVLQLAAGPANAGQPWTGCSLPVYWPLNLSAVAADVLLVHTPGNISYPSTLSGSTLVPELPGGSPQDVAVAYSSWVTGLIGQGEEAVLQLTPKAPLATMLVTAHSSVDSTFPLTSAVQSYQTYAALVQSQGGEALLASHVTAMQDVWQGGLEVDGNVTLATIVNSSLYNIYLSLRDDWPASTGPGGIAGNGYGGHTFWDQETWQFPNLMLTAPGIVTQAANYRINRVPAAQQRAADRGYYGAMWPWQCAVTGVDTCRDPLDNAYEQHIGADIALSWRQLYYITMDKSFLQSIWPALQDTCHFWACRMTRSDSATNATAPYPGPGQGLNCSAKTGTGNWTVRGIVPADEAARVVDDNPYTNAGASQSLSWCIEAAGILGHPIPSPVWADMAASPYLPTVMGLDPNGPVHQEYTGYNGSRIIQQADVALLQYPLTTAMDPILAARDLNYWISVTNMEGMFTGDTVYAAAYLALGMVDQADAQFKYTWDHLDNTFYVPRETQSGGTHHFITGAGSFLQVLLYGYPGLRIVRPGTLSFTYPYPTLPASLGVRGMKLRGIHCAGSAADVWYNSTALCAQVNSGAARAQVESLSRAHTPMARENGEKGQGVDTRSMGSHGRSPGPLPSLYLVTTRDGKVYSLGEAQPVCVPVQPVEVTVTPSAGAVN